MMVVPIALLATIKVILFIYLLSNSSSTTEWCYNHHRRIWAQAHSRSKRQSKKYALYNQYAMDLEVA